MPDNFMPDNVPWQLHARQVSAHNSGPCGAPEKAKFDEDIPSRPVFTCCSTSDSCGSELPCRGPFAKHLGVALFPGDRKPDVCSRSGRYGCRGFKAPLVLFRLGSPALPEQNQIDVFLQFPSSKWVFPKIGVSQNGWFIMENPFKMDDLGFSHYFGNHQIWLSLMHQYPYAMTWTAMYVCNPILSYLIVIVGQFW